jgi:hypothetical protein
MKDKARSFVNNWRLNAAGASENRVYYKPRDKYLLEEVPVTAVQVIATGTDEEPHHDRQHKWQW